jgi:hypothetical protein
LLASFRHALTLLALAATGATELYAADKIYQEQLNAYKAEVVREPLDVQNSSFYGLVAESQAKRAIRDSQPHDENIAVTDEMHQNKHPNDGSVNIASPQIVGTVRGNINIVVERGAFQGNITSVKKR